ncbi:hypothetical protein HL42_0420 [Trichophyton rubrum]|nr:hypothetical protein HL42_0420 [Trichophyton rubrum]
MLLEDAKDPVPVGKLAALCSSIYFWYGVLQSSFRSASYKVRWANFPVGSDSWHPSSHVPDATLLIQLLLRGH